MWTRRQYPHAVPLQDGLGRYLAVLGVRIVGCRSLIVVGVVPLVEDELFETSGRH